MYLSNQNSKLKKSGIFSWGIPAGDTCPGKNTCAFGCYARQGFFVMPTVKRAQEKRLEFSKSPDFVPNLIAEIKKRKVKILRIHDSGDFYSKVYLENWMAIIRACPEVQFYAYTKMVPFFQNKILPENFRVIFSFGGKWDHKIKPLIEPHSKVFSSTQELKKAKYSDASKDDTVALNSRKVGLVYHGAKSKQWLTQ